MNPTLIEALREKAGDGSTDYLVELRQSDLAELLGRHVCGPPEGALPGREHV